MTTNYRIDLSPYWFKTEGIKKIEEMYDAKYLGFWCTRHSGGWWNDYPVDVFYQSNPDREKGHTNYFGMFTDDGRVMITNAESAFSEPMIGIALASDEVIVSRYRHHCIQTENFMIDGGRDYLRFGGTNPKRIRVTVDGSSFVFTEIE